MLGIDLEQLRGRRVIAINSSVHVDRGPISLFWRLALVERTGQPSPVANFSGRVVTISQNVEDKKILICRKGKPPGLSAARDTLMQKWTSLTAATNLAAHLVGRGGTIVWLGADGKAAPDGSVWHHKPHRWGPHPSA